MKYVYVFLAMSRSGHHGVLNWLIRQFEGKVLHHNHATKGWDKGEFSLSMHQYRHKTPGPHRAEIFSIEDFDPPDWQKYDMANFRQLREADEVRVALVVRDPFNWIASSKKISVPADLHGHEISERRNAIWKRQVCECLGETDYIPGRIAISFNRWFCDRDYRQAIAEFFDVSFTDAGLNEVSHHGQGSSWTKRQFDGQAQKMPVLERWREFAYERWFQDAIDDEMMGLSEEFFRFTPELPC